MIANYSNRYGDNIQFKELGDDKIYMSGFGSYYRVAHDNDYSQAYELYCEECSAMEEPDVMLLHEDIVTSSLRKLTYQEFAHTVRDAMYDKESAFYKYMKLVEVDRSRLFMIDASGGPYIQLGTDVGRYFDDGKSRIVDEITVHEEYALLTVSHERARIKRRKS